MEKQKTRKPRVDERTTEQRIADLVTVRLEGGEFWDLRLFVRQKEAEVGSAWYLSGGKPHVGHATQEIHPAPTRSSFSRSTITAQGSTGGTSRAAIPLRSGDFGG